MVKKTRIVFLLAVIALITQTVSAQTKWSKIIVDPHMKDTFSFAQQWAYAWDLITDEATGKFLEKTDGTEITPADTAHLFYTASCTTNVQGGYHIRYATAVLQQQGLMVTIADGLPAYASEFHLHLKGDSFSFIPRIHYPKRFEGEKRSYTITRQQLTLNKAGYHADDTMMGYIDVEFVQVVTIPRRPTQRRTYYLKGYIRTKVMQGGR